MGDERDWDARADELADRAVADGAPTRWFDELWSQAERDEIDTPWDRDAPSPPLVERVHALGEGAGRRAAVVGAGLGADAELLAGLGWDVLAFDVSPAAVRQVRARRRGSPVRYVVADLLELPAELRGAFDLVAEVYTVQALPRSLRARAVAGARTLLAPGGTLVAVQMVRGSRPAEQGPPWLLDRAEMESFAGDDVVLDDLAVVPHPTRPDGPEHWVAVLTRRP